MRKITDRIPTLAGIARWLKALTKHAWKDELFFMASALSFDALMAAIPLAILSLALLTYLMGGGPASPESIDSFMALFIPEAERIQRAQEIIGQIFESRSQISFLAIPVYLLFATRMFASASTALNRVLQLEHKRPFLQGLLRDVILVLVTTVLIVANSVVSLPAFNITVLDYVSAHALAIAFGSILFFVVYSIAPDKPMRWDKALAASLFASVAFETAKIMFGLYLANFASISRVISHANAIAAVLFVVWVYYTALIFLLGGEVAKMYAESELMLHERIKKRVAKGSHARERDSRLFE